jgi:hypothetical protein
MFIIDSTTYPGSDAIHADTVQQRGRISSRIPLAISSLPIRLTMLSSTHMQLHS